MNILQTQDKETVDSFLEFVRGLLEWSRFNGLEKDWVLQYSCYFLDRELHVEDADMLTDPLPAPDDPSLFTFPFEFKFDEWFPGYESKEKYEERINLEFQGKLSAFFQDEGRRLNLDRANDNAIKGVTKPGEYDQLKWLIAWNEGATAEQIAKKFLRSESAVSGALKRLGEYQLPIRKGNVRHRSQLSSKRIEEIKNIEISTF